MRGKTARMIRKLVKKKFRFDYEKMIQELQQETRRTKIRFILGLTKRLLFTKTQKQN